MIDVVVIPYIKPPIEIETDCEEIVIKIDYTIILKILQNSLQKKKNL